MENKHHPMHAMVMKIVTALFSILWARSSSSQMYSGRY